MRTPGATWTYLDYNATTPLDGRVLEAMMPFLTGPGANASSSHRLGRSASEAVERARSYVAQLIGCHDSELIFTSGATEANNLALKGLAACSQQRRHIVTCSTEHPSVLECLSWLEMRGFAVTRVGVDRRGRIRLDELAASVDHRTLLITVMAANNETGTIAPLEDIAAIARASGALFHTDATQFVGHFPLNVHERGVDLASLSGHKIYAPQGTGALYVRRDVRGRLEAQLHGGGQEHGLRSGTHNVAGCVGLGTAAHLTQIEGHNSRDVLQDLRDYLHSRIARALGDVALNGDPALRVPSTLNLRFKGADAEAVMANLRTVAVSTGSACSSQSPTLSHVLLAMGLSREEAGSSLRFSLGRGLSRLQLDRAAEEVATAVTKVRAIEESTPYSMSSL